MGTDQHETHTAHVDAVLEPITPSSRYDYVEIEQERIGFVQPLDRMPGVIARWVRMSIASFKRIWIGIALFILVLIVAEFALRTIEPRLMGRVYDASLTGGYPIEMNAQGFRGKPVSIPKKDNTTRILALGDSVTMGTGIAAIDTWPAQLQARLNTPDQPVEVLNTGLPALDLAQIELELRSRWSDMQPDQIVLVVSGNMISFAIARSDREVVEPPTPKARAETQTVSSSGLKSELKTIYTNLAIPNALLVATEHFKFAIGLENHRYNPDFPAGVMLAHGYIQDGAAPERMDDAYLLVREQLAQLKATADELGLPMVIAYAPPRFTLDDSVQNNLKFVDRDRLSVNPIERIRSICDELDIPFVDPSDELRAAQSPAYVLSDYTHYSPSGHDALAEAIAKAIIQR